MVASHGTRRIPIFFLYRRIAVLDYQNTGPDDTWSFLEDAMQMANHTTRLVISHITTRNPGPNRQKLPFSRAEVTCDLGTLLFASHAPEVIYGVCALPRVGTVYVTGHQRDQLQLYFVRESIRTPDYHLVFDLDETLIFNPLMLPAPVPGSEPVNARPPHTIMEPLDIPRVRPNVKSFLQLVCPYFDQIRVCTLSMRQRANLIISMLDPKQQTLLKNQPTEGRVIICREDMQGAGENPWLASAMPSAKTLESCRLPPGKENRTVVLDDNWQIWPPHLKENVIAVVPPQEMAGLSHDAYINGQDGGILGKYILVCLANLALKEERRSDLIITQLPVGVASQQPLMPAPAYKPYEPKRAPTGYSYPDVAQRPSYNDAGGYAGGYMDTVTRGYTSNTVRPTYAPKYTPLYSNAEPVHSRVTHTDYAEEALRTPRGSFYSIPKRAKSASSLRLAEQGFMPTRTASPARSPYVLRNL